MESGSYVFISYSSKNQNAADSVRRIFSERGIPNWMAPYDIPSGSKYAAEINRALKNCGCLLLLLSNAAQDSEHVDREVERALSYRKPIIPVQIEDLLLNDSFEYYIGSCHIIAVPELRIDSADFERVIQGVKKLVAVVEPEPRPEPKPRAAAPKPEPKPKAAPAPRPPRKKSEAANWAQQVVEEASRVERDVAEYSRTPASEYRFPSGTLLASAAETAPDQTEEIRKNIRLLEDLFDSFKIKGRIIHAVCGPSVTRYEVELEKDMRLTKLTNIADDIALGLGVSGVRIYAVHGKKSIVGIEVPNGRPSAVSLREILEAPEFIQHKGRLPFAVGRDIDGNALVGDLAKLPHLLVGGRTGSGKTGFIHGMILSILYKTRPEDVKFILIDPKVVEFSVYNGLPHLLLPVITHPTKAVGAMQWVIAEMLRRFEAMSGAGVRDIDAYNAAGQQKLPRLVIVIDELADLMLVHGKDTEDAVCRIAQMGRAAGIHLVVSTQWPTTDVITGLLKANIPSRVAFAVSIATESRILLDTQGAEKLLGKGDMLYAPIALQSPVRVQGCFVSDSEVEAVAGSIRRTCPPAEEADPMKDIYIAPVVKTADTAEQAGEEALFVAAADVILEAGQVSVSLLQRRLKIGYARAARLIDELEGKGIVGSYMGTKPRQILVTKEQWKAMKAGK